MARLAVRAWRQEIGDNGFPLVRSKRGNTLYQMCTYNHWLMAGWCLALSEKGSKMFSKMVLSPLVASAFWANYGSHTVLIDPETWSPPHSSSSSSSPSYALQNHLFTKMYHKLYHLHPPDILLLWSSSARDQRYPLWSGGVMMAQTLITPRQLPPFQTIVSIVSINLPPLNFIF